ncbi:MurR/RpiR family transcriptional regulator [Guggenheimella bovis]
MNKIHTLIRTQYHTLSDPQKHIADLFLENSKELLSYRLSDVAELAQTSDTTVMRFLQKIGFSSFRIFRSTLAQELLGDDPKEKKARIHMSDSLDEARNKLIHRTTDALLDLENSLDLEAIEILAEKISTASRVLILSTGASAPVGLDFFNKIIKLGLPVIRTEDPLIMRLASNALDEDSLLLCIHHSGEGKNLIEALKKAKARGAFVASLTSFTQSSLASLSDLTLSSSTYDSPTQNYAMVSRIVQLTVLDIVYVALLKCLGERGKEMLQRFTSVVQEERL